MPFEQIWQQLASGREAYRAAISPVYDEVLLEVAQHAAVAGCLGKADIGALVVWKRMQANTPWVADLMAIPEAEVRAVTKQAVAAVRDTSLGCAVAAQRGREALWELPGFGHSPVLASAVLTAAAPERMAVYDRRAKQALESLGFSLGPARGLYGRYMQVLDQLLAHSSHAGRDWTARDIDTALYWIGGQD